MLTKQIARLCHIVFITTIAISSSALADSVDVITSVKWSQPQAELKAGFRTSDIGASFHTCKVGPGKDTCPESDTSHSPPKNIGNVLCIPTGLSYTVTGSCTTLLNAGEGDCKENSAKGQCGDGWTEVRPSCNYRTDKKGSAQWIWLVTGTSPITVDCSEDGYVGYTQ